LIKLKIVPNLDRREQEEVKRFLHESAGLDAEDLYFTSIWNFDFDVADATEEWYGSFD